MKSDFDFDYPETEIVKVRSQLPSSVIVDQSVLKRASAEQRFGFLKDTLRGKKGTKFIDLLMYCFFFFFFSKKMKRKMKDSFLFPSPILSPSHRRGGVINHHCHSRIMITIFPYLVVVLVCREDFVHVDNGLVRLTQRNEAFCPSFDC